MFEGCACWDDPEVADEEARQWRAFNLMFSVLAMRGQATAELAHPLWNDFKRSVSKAGLQGTLMKGVACVNYGAGPWKSACRRITIRQSAERLMRECDETYLSGLNERINFDRRRPGNWAPLTREGILSSMCVRRRLPYVSQLQYVDVGERGTD